METKFDGFGVDFSKPIPNIEKGDLVEYVDTKVLRNKKIKTPLRGFWDGEKVEFNDKEQTIVRAVRWLTKIN